MWWVGNQIVGVGKEFNMKNKYTENLFKVLFCFWLAWKMWVCSDQWWANVQHGKNFTVVIFSYAVVWWVMTLVCDKCQTLHDGGITDVFPDFWQKLDRWLFHGHRSSEVFQTLHYYSFARVYQFLPGFMTLAFFKVMCVQLENCKLFFWLSIVWFSYTLRRSGMVYFVCM